MTPKYGDIWHYTWENVARPKVHSAVFVIGAPRDFGMALLLPISDTHFNFGLNTAIVAKAAAMYEPCTAACPFNSDYEGEHP